MINTFENCNCQGSCKQDGLLHWEILKSDYLTLNDDYKDCGIVYFVKEKPDSKTGIIIRNNVVYNGEKDSEDYKEVYVVENLPEEGKKQSVYINNQIAYSWNGESYEKVNLIKGDKGDILISDGIDWAAPVDLSIYPPEKGEGAATYAIINKNGGGIQLNNGEEISTPNLKWTNNGWSSTQNSFDGKYCLEVKDSAQVLFDKGAKVGIRDSAYHIQDGNTSFVMHDESSVVMRGPWVEKSKSLSSPEEIIKKKPWQDCQNYEGWRRPVSIKNGPLNSMYDQSGFMMRGVWDTEKDINRLETLTLTLEEEDPIKNETEVDIDKLASTSTTFKKWQKANNTYYEKELVDKYQFPEEESEEKNKIEYESGAATLKITNLIYTTCPPDWKPFVDKIEDSPLVQITDNANIRISENFTMTADNNGITIVVPPAKQEVEEESVMAAEAPEVKKEIKFTYEQLEKLLEIVNEKIEQDKNKEAML